MPCLAAARPLCDAARWTTRRRVRPRAVHSTRRWVTAIADRVVPSWPGTCWHPRNRKASRWPGAPCPAADADERSSCGAHALSLAFRTMCAHGTGPTGPTHESALGDDIPVPKVILRPREDAIRYHVVAQRPIVQEGARVAVPVTLLVSAAPLDSRNRTAHPAHVEGYVSERRRRGVLDGPRGTRRRRRNRRCHWGGADRDGGGDGATAGQRLIARFPHRCGRFLEVLGECWQTHRQSAMNQSSVAQSRGLGVAQPSAAWQGSKN